MEVKQSDNEKKGSFYIEIDNMKAAEMTYTHAGPNKIIIDHTEVSDTLKGQGIGYKLIDAAVVYIRANNLKVIPLCPFANAFFKKRAEEYANILA
ncbi:GNAT family N-acetyltransferase [Confluentibacter flavum]|uniref:GNAT family N-acetyltransferase n=1 Tax=Confluentibacter flavum TaxID=1909700 RepID=A0A2N3HNY8_9FLAO|nr:GNAT family N-acetyltransferase [Confluentibacter flavum]PKQ46574.1 GNAT family N-acetyltransferase [Confluentibacter flavum]